MGQHRTASCGSPHNAGINQTVVFALVMVIFGALIGTIDLGQLIMASLSKKGGAGIGLTLGIFVAFMCLAVDNLIQTWAKEKEESFGNRLKYPLLAIIN